MVDEDETAAYPVRRTPRRKLAAPLSRATLVGRYLILEPLGEGGMGIVYAAYDPELDRKIALKLVRARDRGNDEDAQGRLVREAHAMAKLSHPNVVPVFDVGTFGERVFVAMELVEGTTLRGWLTKPRAWRDILDVFVAAGRGLAAAHAAGMVHRDFKPDNVLIGNDGRARVTDFGLARAEHTLPEDDAPRVRDSRPLEVSLTAVGSIVGTPAYMAPEQATSQVPDARTDQFAFCVSLYEGLYGVRPFDGKGDERTRQIAEASVREPAVPRSIPKRIRAAILKGLAARPEDRHPSMDVLLAELAIEPVGRRRFVVVAAASAAAAVGAITVAHFTTADGPRPCLDADARLAGVWDESARHAVQHRFLATNSPYARDAWASVAPALNAYASAWVRMRTDACEATRVRGDQTEEVMTLRMTCLDERHRELAAFVSVLREADDAVVLKSQSAARQLQPIAACADVAALLAPIRPPKDPALQGSIDEVRRELATSRALRIAGKYDAALAMTKPLLERAAKIAYRPLEAEARFALAKLYEYTGDIKRAKDEAIAAFEAAEAGTHHTFKVHAAGLVAMAAAKIGQFEIGQQYGRLGLAVLEHLDNPTLRAEYLVNLAVLYVNASELPECIDAGTQAIALYAKHDPENINVIPAQINVARCFVLSGRFDEASEVLQDTLQRLARHFPSRMHPIGTSVFFNLGDIENSRGDYPAALRWFEQAVALSVETHGQNHPETLDLRTHVAVQYVAMGDYAKASAMLESNLAAQEASNSSELSRSVTLTFLAEAKLQSGDLAQAEVLARRVLALDEKLYGTDAHDLVIDHVVLGEVLAARGRRAEALASFRRAEVLQKKAVKALNRCRLLTAMGTTLQALGDPSALATLEAAVAAADSDVLAPFIRAEARFALARALADRTRAVALARQARDEYANAFARGERRIGDVDAWLASQ